MRSLPGLRGPQAPSLPLLLLGLLAAVRRSLEDGHPSVPHLWHMEVPRLGIESKLQPQQLQIRAMSATYTTAHGNAGSLTH